LEPLHAPVFRRGSVYTVGGVPGWPETVPEGVRKELAKLEGGAGGGEDDADSALLDALAEELGLAEGEEVVKEEPAPNAEDDKEEPAPNAEYVREEPASAEGDVWEAAAARATEEAATRLQNVGYARGEDVEMESAEHAEPERAAGPHVSSSRPSRCTRNSLTLSVSLNLSQSLSISRHI
jgi:hypothetical protein